MKKFHLVVALSSLFLATACRDNRRNQVEKPTSDTTYKAAPPAPDWAKFATIYEINTGQFSHQGNFKGIEAQLPRLKEMGVDVIWLMPIYPISRKDKQGTLGNPYAVADYESINSDYGTLSEFKSLVNRTHALGMRVVLDWVASHTGTDHTWMINHPDWYSKKDGKLIHPTDAKIGKPTGWDNVVKLDYDNPAVRQAMIDAMQYWVRETNIDGFRCTAAGYVPNTFWSELRPKLDKIKPMFMLAEWEDDPTQFKHGFNMNYSWSLYHMMKNVAKGVATADKIDSVCSANQQRFPAWYYQMLFTQNHNENANDGTLTEVFGPGADAFVVLSSTLQGMPLVYNGMESNLSRRLNLFNKDSIAWGNYAKSDFYKTLLTLKHRNRALWNGKDGGKFEKISTDHDDKIYAFHRQRDNDRVVVILNLSNRNQTVRLNGDVYVGMYTEVFSHQPVDLRSDMLVSLRPWEYRVLTN